MTDPNEIAVALVAIADAFDVLAVTWAIGGSLASAAHGEPRATNDVDVVATLTPQSARQFAAQLGEAFYADPDVAAEAARSLSSFNVIDNRSFIKIDVFIPAPGPLGAGQLDRRQLLPVFQGVRPLPILGPEDVVLQKLRWYELGGGVSDRQWRDIVSVLRIGAASIDQVYLTEVAAHGGLTTLLDRARADAQRG